jgi:hypothetical protein
MVRFLPQESVKKGFAGKLGVAYMRLYVTKTASISAGCFASSKRNTHRPFDWLSRYRMPRLMA